MKVKVDTMKETKGRITEYVLKLQGKVTLLSELKFGNSFKVELDGAVDQVADEDNQDGSYTRYYRFRPILAKVIADNGEVTRTKDMRKRGQQMRAVLRREWQELNEPITEEEYYDREMTIMIQKRINGEI